MNIILQPLSMAIKIDPKEFQEVYAENEIRFYEEKAPLVHRPLHMVYLEIATKKKSGNFYEIPD